ncbi:MAG TPA: [protein-PII] uridylyltransferase [Acidimicrobiales bacterium]|nr:[protein-PII] uridylyltransferase [Acidimicrobiales bacterium]
MADLRERRQALLGQPDLRGKDFCRAYARAADEWLSGVAERAAGSGARRLALLAVGGYGRAELCPFSDLDVVLVHEGHRDVSAVADAIWYPVWDQGVHLDHSVRRPREVLAAADGDLRVALGLLDARLVWGDERLVAELLSETVSRWRSNLGARWLPTLRQQMADRHRSQGEVAFLLEPDLKESHGGLRDANVLRAIAAYAPRLADHVDLHSVEPSTELLTSIRVELHRRAGRALDRLLLQEQDQVAALLSFADADALMAAVSEAGRRIAWALDDAWRRQASWQPTTGHRRGLRRPRPESELTTPTPSEPGIVMVAGEVDLTPDAALDEDSSLPLRLAALASESNRPIARAALHRLADHMAPAPDPWPIETREALVRALSSGHRATESFEALDHADVLTRLLPEWAPVRHRPQRNAYHRFTVDRHLLEAAANAADLTERVARPDLLLVGTLLHDIGKGYPGDHTQVGVELMGRIGRRMGFGAADVAVLVCLVQLHLLLPDAATRRDLEDPATIDAVAAAVGDVETLHLLAALSEADGLATGSSAWGPWKAGLVADLVHRTADQLEGKASTRGPRWSTEAYQELVAEVRRAQRPAVVLDPPRVIVAAIDRPGLLASVAGTVALHGLDVRSADATSEDGVALEVFTVEVARGSWPDGAKLRQDLDAVLSGHLALEAELSAKADAYAGQRRAWTAHTIVPQVVVDNAASASATVLEVRARDELGLLHRVTRALFDCELDVVSARVSTIGSEVVDAFYVRDATGGKVTGPEDLRRIEAAVRAAVERRPDP